MDKPIREATACENFGGRFSISLGRWKLVMPLGKFVEAELYDLAADFGEKNNVADEYLQIVAGLADLLEMYKVQSYSRVLYKL